MPPVACHRTAFRTLAAALIGVTAALLAAVPAGAQDAPLSVSALLVKWRAESGAWTPALSAAQQDEIANALRTGFVASGVVRDGALRIELMPPLPLAQARAALNRLRLDARVLYADVAADSASDRARGSTKAAGLPSPPTDRVIVRYRDADKINAAGPGSAAMQARLDRVAAVAGTPVSFVRTMHDGTHVLRLFQRLPIAQVEAIAERIEAQPDVEFAQPDYIDRIAAVPADPCYASSGSGACSGGFQWDLFEAAGGINMPPAWNVTTGVSNLFVAVVDTGALFNHPDLANRLIGGYDMIISSGFVSSNDGDNRDADASDPGDWNSAGQCGTGSAAASSSWHGSHVAGTIGARANNGAGVAGINWVSRIVPVRALGRCGGFSSDIADGIVWASGSAVPGVPANPNPARVINLSLGGTRSSQTCDAVYQSAINTALANNTVLAVSAGNGNQSASFNTPGNCAGVITVAATGRTGGRASYSNFGSLVEIAAPGGDFALAAPNDLGILSTISSSATSPGALVYSQYYGTSMAAPHVTGVVSLMLSVRPALTPAQVLSKIQTSARAFPVGTGTDCTTLICGAGILDAGAAVAAAAGIASTTTLGASPNPVSVGANVTFTATVTGSGPTGTVRFVDGYAVIAGCAAVALNGTGNVRTALCTTNALGLGAHAIAAEYSGDATNGASQSAAITETVASGSVGTTTGLSSSSNPSIVGASVTLTATVTGSAPTGSVAFADGGTPLAGCTAVTLTGSGNSREAACTTAALALGTHSIVATYAGDVANNGSASAPLSQTVVATPTTTSLASSANPAAAGTTIMFTATVAGNAPTGAVTFFDGVSALAACTSIPLSGAGNSRTAACTIATLSVGAHPMVATYSGNSANQGSSSAPLAQSVTAGAPPRKSRDFEGNGITDILWRDDVSGTTALWLMNGTAAAGTSTLITDPDWTPTHTGFFDADNDADIVWHNNATGETQLWHMNGAAPASISSLFTSNVWSVTHVADFTGDGKADLLWRNSATGQTALWLMNGLTSTATSILSGDPNWVVVPPSD